MEDNLSRLYDYGGHLFRIDVVFNITRAFDSGKRLNTVELKRLTDDNPIVPYRKDTCGDDEILKLVEGMEETARHWADARKGITKMDKIVEALKAKGFTK